VFYETPDGDLVVGEATNSWCFVGSGLRITIELLGPEYSGTVNTLESGTDVFFSDRAAEDAGYVVEKREADRGAMPVLPQEAATWATSTRTNTSSKRSVPVATPVRTFATASKWPKRLPPRTLRPSEASGSISRVLISKGTFPNPLAVSSTPVPMESGDKTLDILLRLKTREDVKRNTSTVYASYEKRRF